MNTDKQSTPDLIISSEIQVTAKENSEVLRKYLQKHNSASLKLKGSEEIAISDLILRLVYQAFVGVASGKKLRLVEEDEEVSTERAAEFLQLSRPYLVKLLDKNEIPFHFVGTHRRITMSDLIRYKQERKKKSKKALGRMTDLAEGMGLYDDE